MITGDDAVSRGGAVPGGGVVPGGMDDLDPRELDRLRDLVELNTDWIWEVDADGRYVYSSPRGEEILGRSTGEILGHTPFDFMTEAEAARVRPLFAEIVADRRSFSGLINHNLHADGSVRVLETSGVPVLDSDGHLRGYRGIDRDITDLVERTMQWEAMYAAAPIALCIVDRDLVCTRVNSRFARLFGTTVEQVEGVRLAELSAAAAEKAAQSFAAIDRGEPVTDAEFSRGDSHFLATVGVVGGVAQPAVALSVAVLDITRRKAFERQLAAANEKLELYSRQDFLTELGNRRHFSTVLTETVSAALRSGSPVSLLLVDVDHFKPYNDAYGHLAGDECLRTVAALLAEAVGKDSAFRFGGDEFAVILPGRATDEAHAVAARIRAAMELQHLPHKTNPFGRVTMSIGTATWQPADGDQTADGDADEDSVVATGLVSLADEVLYLAKNSVRNTIRSAVYPTTVLPPDRGTTVLG